MLFRPRILAGFAPCCGVHSRQITPEDPTPATVWMTSSPFDVCMTDCWGITEKSEQWYGSPCVAGQSPSTNIWSGMFRARLAPWKQDLVPEYYYSYYYYCYLHELVVINPFNLFSWGPAGSQEDWQKSERDSCHLYPSAVGISLPRCCCTVRVSLGVSCSSC